MSKYRMYFLLLALLFFASPATPRCVIASDEGVMPLQTPYTCLQVKGIAMVPFSSGDGCSVGPGSCDPSNKD